MSTPTLPQLANPAIESFAPRTPALTATGTELATPKGGGVIAALSQRARELGFARIGVADALATDESQALFEHWLAQGYHGSMKYLEQPRRSPEELLPGAKSVIVGAFSYGAHNTQREPSSVAAYAEGPDYHYVLKQQLRLLAQTCADLLGCELRARLCVDTAPLLERAWAARAGVGFTGKSTLSIVPGVGSAVLLAEVIIDQPLPISQPIAEGCGECTRCLTACPTNAFVDAYTLDARRCISYLTIESQAAIPVELRPGVGQRIFGCDECQRVCPYNASRKLPPRAAPLEAQTPFTEPEPAWLLGLGSSAYRRWVDGTARRRTSRAQMQRNAAVALGNRRDPSTVPVLVLALRGSTYPLVRGHVAWALGQIGGAEAQSQLALQLTQEDDPGARQEIEAALNRLASGTASV